MPISKIKTSVVDLDNLEIGGTEAAKMPEGTAAQRGSSFKSGDIRFNTDINLMEYYDGTSWRSIDAPPTITSIASSSIPDSNSSFDLVINGSLFASGAQVKLIGTDDSEVSATVSVDTSSQITATIDGTALSNAAEDYDVKVINPSGLSAILENSVSVNASPVWSTAAGSLGIFNHIAREGISITVTATDPEGSSVTYSVTSGSLPSGLSLNGSTGVISGDAASVSSDTTSSFTISASDGVNSSSRNFSITNKAVQVYVYSYTGSDQSFTVPSNVSKIKTYIWGAGGTHNNPNNSNSGGSGGYSESIIGVTAAENFVVVVGQGGISYANGLGNGYGGGGTGSASQGGGGGGLSGIFTGTSQVFSGYTPQSGAHARSLIIAGGGGGAGIDNSDALQTPNGGGINGLSAGVTGGGSGLAQGGGGTQTAGGALGGTDTSDTGTAGSALQGGYAVSGSGASGGGGGYYGGGAGRHDAGEATGHGGGGSGFIGFQDGSTSSVLSPTSGNNYTDTTTRTNGSRTYKNSKTLVATAQTTNSSTATSPPETSNTYYTGFQSGTYSPQGSGATGYYAGYGQRQGANGADGLVVIEM